MITESTASELRETGISVIGDVRWGTHFCSFYETKEDLLETLVPYFKAGLENKEFCLWIVSQALGVDEAKQALKQAVPDLERYMEAGGLEIHTHDDWYLRDGRWDPQRVLQSWSEKLNRTEGNGYAGSRGAGDGGWIQQDDKMVFCEYEKEVNRLIADQRSIILCTYPLTTSPGEQVFDIAHIHQAAVARRNGHWEMIESPQLNQAKAEIKRLNEELEQKIEKRTRELAATNAALKAEIAERKLAEQAVKQAEDRFRLVIDTIPTMAWSLRADGVVDFVNQRWVDYTGVSFRDAIRKPNGIVHPDDLPRVLEKWLADRVGGKPSEDEMRLRRADGEYRWFLIRTVPLRDGKGEITKWYGTGSDIEDRKQAEMQARTLIDAIPHQIWSGPADGTLDYCNERWRSYMGLELEDLSGDGWQSMLHPEDRGQVLKAWRESVSNGTPYEQEERHRGADGTYRWFLSRGVPMRDAGGRIVRWYGTNTDIEDRKRAEEALRKSEKLFTAFMDHLPGFAWMKDVDGRYVYVNKKEAELDAYHDGAIGKRDADLWPTEIASAYRANDRLVMATKKALETVEPSLASGQPSSMMVCKFPILDQDGSVVMVAGAGVDITERKRADEKLRKVNEQLHVLSRRLFQVQESERRHLARELHDEIGQALTAVKINVESLGSVGGYGESFRLKDTIAILDNLLGQVRQISLDLHPSLLDDLGLIPALRSLLDQQARRTGLRMQFSAPEPLPHIPPGLQTTAFRIAQEAITNVMRHARAQSVRVNLSIEAGRLRMRIVDDGRGFDTTEVERDAQQDAGFGLIGMKERAALIGGRIQVTSSPRNGTVIEVLLPL